MSGLPRGYDEWRTSTAEDEEELRERRRMRAEYEMERADDLRDRQKDQRAERERNQQHLDEPDE